MQEWQQHWISPKGAVYSPPASQPLATCCCLDHVASHSKRDSWRSVFAVLTRLYNFSWGQGLLGTSSMDTEWSTNRRFFARERVFIRPWDGSRNGEKFCPDKPIPSFTIVLRYVFQAISGTLTVSLGRGCWRLNHSRRKPVRAQFFKAIIGPWIFANKVFRN